ncbi:acyltransferase [Alicyclobacillus suci]|uniref:acyltransferase n=1 Tax=Alicyclobacillus suci TaxID=2816080 RepID=UPI001A8FCAA7|nr:acyltransferase [Alicyclobacillus suci]
MGKRHLYEIDLMRAFIMLAVLSVHTTSFFLSMSKHMANTDLSPTFLTIGALLTSLHFTRESFMFITGLVLFITYYRRPFRTIEFWKKRFFLIAVPYIVWTLSYIVFKGLNQPTNDYWAPATLWHDVLHSLMTGNQYYLYYVLLTMQLYLVFPIMLQCLRKLERYHLHILLASFVLQLLLMAACKFVLPHVHYAKLPTVMANADRYRSEIFLTYQFWFVAGGILACHYDNVCAFIKRHSRLVLIALCCAVPIVWAHYLFDRLILHEVESISEAVLQPIMVPYSLLVTARLWYTGMRWSVRRLEARWQPFSRFVQLAANTSFGIFLIQPFPIVYMEKAIHHLDHAGIPTWLHYSLWPFCILFVYFTGMFFAHWLSKIPYLAYLVGRKHQPSMHKSTFA